MINIDEEIYEFTFSQREGITPLPRPMELGSVTQTFRNLVWRAIDTEINSQSEFDFDFYTHPEGIPEIIESYQFEIEQRPHDGISYPAPEHDRHFARKIVLNGEYHEVITLVEYILRHNQCSAELMNSLIGAFDNTSIAYFVTNVNGKPTVFPRITREAGEATKKAIKTLQIEGAGRSAAVHLGKATKYIDSQDYGDSIRESIHAVESVARNISSNSNNTLKPALETLEKEGFLKHSALKSAFDKLYGYTSDEEGIRHALLNKDTADVGLDEAIFMLGACASFAAYLVNKQQQRER